MNLKSIKLDTWTSKCLWGDAWDPWVAKMVSQVFKMEPQGHQNVTILNAKRVTGIGSDRDTGDNNGYRVIFLTRHEN